MVVMVVVLVVLMVVKKATIIVIYVPGSRTEAMVVMRMEMKMMKIIMMVMTKVTRVTKVTTAAADLSLVLVSRFHDFSSSASNRWVTWGRK